jgi:DNA modification methylase
LTADAFTVFLATAIGLMVAFSHPGSLHYLCMDWRHYRELLAAAFKHYEGLKNVCIWVKSHPGMGSLYRSQHEEVFVFKQAGASHRNNVQLGRFGRNRTNVWQYPSAVAPAQGDEEGGLLALHPTVKPVTLVADALMDCTSRKDLVLDPFGGSGTTIIAAERTGRRARVMELDPRYVDVAVRRWQRFSRHEAVHADSGELFNAREA